MRTQLTASFVFSSMAFVTLLGPANADILRGGGGGASSAPAAPGTAPIGGATPSDTTQARANAQDALARTTNTLNALRAMQDTARAAAESGPNNLAPGLPTVPNGLGLGGLNPTADPGRWTGAELPTESLDTDGLLNVGVRQTAQQALLDWQTFNVGKETVLNFDQSAGGANAAQWIAFNRITDPSGNPSQILGQINAQGQVYVINPNGIIFGGSSQVNVNTLTLSSLPINNNLIDRGLLNNPDAQFLFSGLNLPSGPNGTPSFTPDAPPLSTGRYGEISIQAGARITTPVSADGNGGRVLLAGPNVTNSGTILTPAGQTILAAGLQVGITAHDASDPSLRGLDVFVGEVGTYGGSSSNTGLISSERGNITIVGKSISNAGALSATTSVSLNGRIDLLAHYGATSNPASGSAGLSAAPFINRQSGTISLGEGSLLSVLPEYASAETSIGTELALRSRINLAGRSIQFGKNSTLSAPNALVNIAAGEWLFLGGLNPTSRFIQSAGQVYIDENALINVAGSIDVEASVAQNIIEVDLRGAELANSPLQRTGPLRGESVKVDIRDSGIYQQRQWLGTPLADISGFANLIQRDIAQLTTAGGSITLSAGQSTVIRSGARIDVSGGSIAFQDAVVQTSQLISNGRLIDISKALPDIVYDGVYDGTFDASDPKWGNSEIFRSSLAPDGRRLEKGYLQGAAGGALSITAPGLALDGQLLGKTFAGELQRSTPPLASALTLNFTSTDRSFASLPAFSPTPPAITFLADPSQLAPDPFEVDADGNPNQLSQDRLQNVFLSPELLSSGGFSNFTLGNPDGSITLPVNTTLATQPRANVSFRASNINIDGTILSPGGSLSFLAPNLTLSQLNTIANSSLSATPMANVGQGIFTLGQNASIDTSGLLIDDRLAYSSSVSLPLALNGGSVTINAFDAILSAGGKIDVSGGARSDARGRISYGNAGSITLSAGRDLNEGSVLGGSLQNGATLLGFSGAKGGTINLSAPAIQIGGATSDALVTRLDPAFFSQGGLANFSLTGIGIATAGSSIDTPGVLVVENTLIRPIVQSRFALAAFDQPLTFLNPIVQPEGVRDSTSISLTGTGAFSVFSQSQLVRGAVTLASGSSIVTDAGGSVILNSQLTSVLGSIYTPGGTISASGAAEFPSDGVPPLLTTLIIGSEATLDASGKTVLVPDPLGLRTGRVFSGGNIGLSGNILALQGAKLIASGASGVLDLVPAASTFTPSALASPSGRKTVPVTIDANGGSITLAGSSFLHSDATLVANAGGASANGGSLTISSSRFVPPNTTSTTADINLVVTGAGNVTSSANPQATGTRPLDENGNPVLGLGRISVDSFATGGFHNLTLGGNIRSEGDVSITLPGSMRLASGGVLEAGGSLAITAGHIYAGQNFRAPELPNTVVDYFTSNIPGVGVQPLSIAPTGGAGALSLNAGLLDIGTLSLRNTDSAAFNASQGDLRGNGILQAAGDLAFTVGQIYPTTGSAFSIFAYGGSTASFLGGSARALPFSAGGTLNVHAASIVHNGVLRAPLGNINLGWNGTGTAPANPVAGNLAAIPVTANLVLGASSITSTSATDPITGRPTLLPYGSSFDGDSWIDPSGLDITTTGPADKDIKLAAQNLSTEEGSVIDISGGGDLLAYRFVSGNGGRADLLASNNLFAVIPGYGFDYAPYAPFNPQAQTLQAQPGYTNTTLRPGDQITLAAGSGLPSGTYTLLPARYGLLPGAFLVTPISGVPTNTLKQPDGSTIVTGYRSNNLNSARTGATNIGNFEVAPATTFLQRAEYQRFEANKFFTDFAQSRGIAIPRLPNDAGILSFTASTDFSLRGSVSSARPAGSRGALIDINSPVEILINSSGLGGAPGVLTLSSGLLNSFGADSLLIGGIRTQTSDGITVTTSSNRLTLDNRDDALLGNDIILTAREELNIADNATIRSSGDRPVGTITLGTTTAGSGNGALVRVSGNLDSVVNRLGVTPGDATALIVGAGVILQGGSVILDSTSATQISDSTSLLGSSVTLSSGEVSLALENAGALLPTTGIVLGGDALSSLFSSSNALTLRSYSNLNLYGSGRVGSAALESFTLQAAAIRGLNQADGKVTFAARNFTIDNPVTAGAPSSALTDNGTLAIEAETINLARGNTRIEGFAQIQLDATSQARVDSQGELFATGDLAIQSPVLLGQQASRYLIQTDGALSFLSTKAPVAVDPGFGVDLSLSGASVTLAGNIVLPSGRLNVQASTGDIVIGGGSSANLDLAGISRQFVDVTRHTSGGSVLLSAGAGTVRILENATVNLSAPVAAGDAGRLDVFTPNGGFESLGNVTARAGIGGALGAFSLDTAALLSTSALDAALNAGFFNGLRDLRIRSGGVAIDGMATSTTYRLAADDGDVIVTGTIDASGARGGMIDLKANGSLILASGAVLDASAQTFDAAGKGGAITLEAGTQRQGQIRSNAALDLQTGSIINLTVAENTVDSASLGKFSGTLHLRAPRTAGNNDLQLAAINSTITGSSAITVEGYKLYDRTAAGTLDSGLLSTIRNESTAYLGTANHDAMLTRLTAAKPSLDLILMPGVEIISRTGDLTLGSTSSTTTADWNLATHRFGPRNAPGVLTLRAAGDLVLFNAISDGFDGGSSLWLSSLIANNPLLPANSQGWSYRFAAGADLSAASHRAVVDASTLAADKGSFLLGKNSGSTTATGGANALTSSIIGTRYQVVRTGSGDIDVNTAGAVRLLNPFASMYTAGTQVADPTGVFAPNDFVTPVVNRNVTQVNLGAAQQNHPAQYSMAGGNVSLNAGTNIERLTRNNSGLIEDSSRQLPNNWLYRRSYVDPDGNFGRIRIGTGFSATADVAASTSWWVDHSNFFQSVGALGGGNIILAAGNDIRNTDAAIPTNARAPRGTPSAASLVELGGGDLRVAAGNDISGGVYYVERGAGSLVAGASITTNATRSPSFGLVANLNNPSAATLDPQTWLPTTLFLGKSSFDVRAAGDILLGPATNPFLLPQGINNRFWYKTHFSTYAPNASLKVLSLGGDVTMRNAAVLPGQSAAIPMLRAWHETQLRFTGTSSSTAFSQPWLRLNETSLDPFGPIWALAPPSLSLTSFSGDLSLTGNITTFPSPSGQVELIAAGSILALQPTGLSNVRIAGQSTRVWTSSTINLSDADPRFVPAPLAPLTRVNETSQGATVPIDTATDFMASLAAMFFESGSFTGINAVLQPRQSRHTRGGLHSEGADPVRIHATGGDLSGLTLFSGKSAWITSSRDITDVALYLQNNYAEDQSIVTAARDIVASNTSSILRIAAQAAGNAVSAGESALPGDIQIAGPGGLQVIAGRDIDLGLGSSLPDGTGGGISSIGNFRNPFLSSEGADILLTAGLGSDGFNAPKWNDFIQSYITTEKGRQLLEEISPGTDFSSLSENDQRLLATEIFFRILRDAGRDFNNPDSPDYGSYSAGMAAIESLYGDPEESTWSGEILARARDIRTRSGGDIRLLAPGGGLALANTAVGNPLAPPGVITEAGGSISIFTDQSVDIGIGRIFTLRGGDAILWSTNGDIAAGSSSRTVQSAPPTRVVIDPQSASVQTDLAGLATGGGIGVLATVEGVDPGDVDLIAPSGIIDAGDAGIRVSGNINLAAVQVVNAGNIAAGGTSAGGAPAVAAPAVSTPAPPASSTTASEDSAASAAQEAAEREEEIETTAQASIYSVEVIGYGGGGPVEEEDEDDEETPETADE